MIEGELVEYLRTVDSPTVSNAIERLRIRPNHTGFAPLELRQFFPEMGRLCGYAVTAQVETVTQMGARVESTFLELFAAVAAALKPGIVVFQEIGAQPEYATHCGEMMATIFQRVGAIGLVTDCGVRDIPEVRALGFQYFARGAVASHANFRIVQVGVPVQVFGLVLQPGDLLHGDENGLVLVPKCRPEELEQAVNEVRSSEGRVLDFVRSAEFSVEKLRGRFLSEFVKEHRT
jgi:4-hydroxy-4-methyl-2-oxoglutarate aldolase